jgi:hypothetical protein
MNPPIAAGVSPAWLSLREAADAAARSAELADLARELLHPWASSVIHDLGCGTGSMGRWLAPRLPGPQHWILCDRDPGLLEWAATSLDAVAADGVPVKAEPRHMDVTRLASTDLLGASLVTASALLDLLTRDEIERMVAVIAGARCPALLTLSVAGRVELTPPDPLDEPIMAAFDAHQRRTAGGRRLLGPDAIDAAAEAFARHGAEVVLRPSPWRLAQGDLTREWLHGWVGAACEQSPELSTRAARYAAARQAQADLEAVVHHRDLFAYFE